MIKCVVFDVGNTLISKSGSNKVEPFLIDDIKRLRNQGILVGIATMRTYSLSKKILENLELDFWICLSGSQIYIDDKLVIDVPLPSLDLLDSGYYPVFYSENDTYALSSMAAQKARKKGFVVESIIKSHPSKIYNIALMDIETSSVKDYMNDYHIEYWSKIKVLVLQNKNSSKAKAIQFLMNYYSLEKHNIMGFGDGPNDQGFLKECGISVAMKGASNELISVVNEVADSENNLGVSKILRKYGLIKDKVIFFIHSLNDIGGMEVHGDYFIRYFSRYTQLLVVTKIEEANILRYADSSWVNVVIDDITLFVEKHDSHNTLVFFNSGHWIEEMKTIKNSMKESTFMYRTGGNDIISAPLKNTKANTETRLNYWRDRINEVIDYVITNSYLTESRLIKFGIKSNKFRRVVGGVDALKIRDYKRNYVSLRKSLFENTNKINLVTVSRFVPYKRIPLLMETMKHLDKEKYHLYVIGEGELKTQILSKYKNLENVSLIGKLNNQEALKYITIADFYVQFSGDTKTVLNGLEYIHTEGMGRALLEAITANTFVVATKCGAFSEIIDNQNGRILELEEPSKIAKEIQTLRKSGVNYTINDRYDFSYVFNAYLKIWRDNE